MLPHIFDELCLYFNTNKFKAISVQDKKDKGGHKGGSMHTRGAKSVEQVQERW